MGEVGGERTAWLKCCTMQLQQWCKAHHHGDHL
jgi:hypothetical protein